MYNYELKLNGQKINSIKEIKKEIMEQEIGYEGIVIKNCNSNHRRNPDQIIINSYKKVKHIYICNICGCIRKTKNIVLKDVRYDEKIIEYKGKCSNPVCKKYKQYFEKENLIFGQCIVNGCNRTAIKDNPCPLHGGQDIFSDINTLKYKDYARWVKESEYPILHKLRFDEDTSCWLVKDLTYEFPKYLEPMSYLSNWEEGNMTQIEMETLFKMERERNG